MWDKAEIAALLSQGKIPGISLCQIINGKLLAPIVLGKADVSLNLPVTENTSFEAASLTKPLFAMLVLKLAREGVIDVDQPFGEMQDINEIQGYKALQEYQEREQLTARMILSHRSGLPNSDASELKFNAKPGEQFKYSGFGYVLLQELIEKRTGKSFAELTREYIFDQVPMPHSYLQRPDNQAVAVHHNADGMKSLPVSPASPAHAASGLYTTASDYARFVLAWLHDRDGLLNSAFDFSKDSNLTTDRWALAKGVSSNELNNLAWGLGWGLLKTDQGIVAFHWGDNGDSKAFVAINLETQTGMVYLANSWNGLAIAPQLISKGSHEIMPALNFLFKKYEFSSCENLNQNLQAGLENFAKYELNNQPGWQDKLQRNVIATLARNPQNFGEINPENTQANEESLKSQLAQQLSRQPSTGLETFMQLILDLPTPIHDEQENQSDQLSY